MYREREIEDLLVAGPGLRRRVEEGVAGAAEGVAGGLLMHPRLYVCTFVCVCIYIYIYIYMYREREIDREREIYIYIYICILHRCAIISNISYSVYVSQSI